MGYYLTIGGLDVQLADPQPDQINIPAILDNLANIRRFSGNPKALTVLQHSGLVAALVAIDPLKRRPSDVDSKACVDYAMVHDYHEGITGDIPGPLKRYLKESGDYALTHLELRLDNAIFGAIGMPHPSNEVRQVVHYYDKVAESLEWRYCLGRPWGEWCHRGAVDMDPVFVKGFIDEVL